MRFKTGDKVVIRKPFLRMGRNHIGAVGVVIDERCYCGRYRGFIPTHYVIKFDCYKIPHIFMIEDIDSSCEQIQKEQ